MQLQSRQHDALSHQAAIMRCGASCDSVSMSVSVVDAFLAHVLCRGYTHAGKELRVSARTRGDAARAVKMYTSIV